MNLNVSQQRAVRHVKGPMMVIAGPGSGKTAVLTHRIQNLIHTANVQEDRILVITFTKAAAEEMRSRYLRLEEKDETEVTFGTFHSVFYSILRENKNEMLKLIAMEEAEMWITEYVKKRTQCDYQEAQWRAFFILSEYSRLVNTDTYDKRKMDTIVGSGFFEEAIQYYRRRKQIEKRIDFDDMLIQLLELFQQDPLLLEGCRQQYQYILVDEFQDINKVQYEILCMIAEPRRNLFIVGDDDQAIYGFRGSQPDYFLKFPVQYPEAQRVELSINYRCREEIVNQASLLINKNQKRYMKHYESGVEGKGYVFVQKVRSEEQEVQRILYQIREYAARMPYENIAVLYRTHAQSEKLIEQLKLWKIPFQCEKEMIDFDRSKIEETMLKFFQYLEDKEVQILKELWPIIAAGIPDYYAEDNLQLLDPRIENEICIRLEEISLQFKKLGTMERKSAMLYIWNHMGYARYLRETAEKNSISWKRIEEEFRGILYEKKHSNKEHGVHLKTMHGSKGLEYEVVIIMDANEGICPYESANTFEALEEERRIFYVAMTRAKTYLHIFYTSQGKRRQKPSRFLRELKY